ncbi:hypothetical protein J2Z32_000726 [Paenibacillus turicensis]|uniref:Uncharacterized protein n=1 Tax=Paenibacillus turicensis TaxID=160487 RepID=A0ABS4FP01_9BACL|nr:hypothetical protein [Paenibacillus turicensis]
MTGCITTPFLFWSHGYLNKQLEPPTDEEGFDKLYRVYAEDGEFVVNEFDNPVAKS